MPTRPVTPVIADRDADSAQLHQRAADDYANAQAARRQGSTRETGSK